MSGWVYMMADRYRGTIYTGVTADIARRNWQHRQGRGSRFVRKYQLLRLVYAEPYERIDDAIAREKAIKEMAAAVEDRADREGQSGLARLDRAYDHGVRRSGTPAVAGVTVHSD